MDNVIDNGSLPWSKIIQRPTDVIVLGAIGFSVYTLGRLTYDLGKEGLRTIKAKKNRTK